MEFSVNYRKAEMLGTVLFCFLIPVFQGVKTTKNYTWSGSSLISIFVFLDVGAGNGFRGGGTAPYSHWGRIRDLTFLKKWLWGSPWKRGKAFSKQWKGKKKVKLPLLPNHLDTEETDITYAHHYFITVPRYEGNLGWAATSQHWICILKEEQKSLVGSWPFLS